MTTITQLAALYDTEGTRDPDPATRQAYAEAGAYFRKTAAHIIDTTGLRVTFTADPDPYPTATAQAHSVYLSDHITISLAYSDHPLWDPLTNGAYRLVHDIIGHAPDTDDWPTTPTVPQFDVRGELRAWAKQWAHMYHAAAPDPFPSNDTLRIAFCETVCQLADAAVRTTFRPGQLVIPIGTLSSFTFHEMANIRDDRPRLAKVDNAETW